MNKQNLPCKINCSGILLSGSNGGKVVCVCQLYGVVLSCVLSFNDVCIVTATVVPVNIRGVVVVAKSSVVVS